MNTTSDIMNAFSQSNTSMSMSSMPSSGIRFMPPPGDYIAQVSKMEVGTRTFNKTNKTVPFVKFHYTILEGEYDQNVVTSDEFFIDPSTPPTAGAIMAKEISMRRLHRNLQVLADRPFKKDENLEDILVEVRQSLENRGDTVVSVNFKVNVDKKGYSHLDDSIRSLTSS